MNCPNCDTYQCFDCDTESNFTFNTHLCPNKHVLINCKELKECNRCLQYCDGYECIQCKYFICTSKICRKFNSQSVKVLPSLKGIISSFSGHTGGVNCIILYLFTQLISCSDDSTIKVWDLNNYQCNKTLLGHQSAVLNLIEIDNELILSSSFDKNIKIWSVFEGTCIKTFSLQLNMISLIRFIGNQIIGCSDTDINFWETSNFNITQELKPHAHLNINVIILILQSSPPLMM